MIFFELEVPSLSITALAQSLNNESSDEANSLKSSFDHFFSIAALVFGSNSDLKLQEMDAKSDVDIKVQHLIA